MKTFKKSTKRTMLFITSIILLAIFVNLVIVLKIRDQVSEIDNNIQNINREYNEMKFGLSSLSNVLSQDFNRDYYSYEDNNYLSNNYETYLSEISDSYDLILSSLNDIDDNNYILDLVTIKFFHESFEIFAYAVEQTRDNLLLFNKEFIKISSTLPDKNTDITYLTYRYNKIDEDIIILGEVRSLLVRKFVRSYTHGNTMLLILLFVTTQFAGRGICKIINVDLNFIMQGFKLLENHNYNYNKLPKLIPKYKEEEEVHNLVKSIMKEQQFATKMKDVVMSNYVIDDLLDELFSNIETDLNIDRIGIAFVDYKNDKIIAEYRTANYSDFNIGPGYEGNIRNSTLGQIIEDKNPLIINDVPALYLSKPSSESLRLICKEGIKSNMIIPLIMRDTVFGILFFSSTEKDSFDKESLRIAQKITYDITGYLNRSYLTKLVFSNITSTFAELVDKKDNETGGHINRMVKYSVIVAEGLLENKTHCYPIDKKLIIEIERQASSHDIGKVGVPDEILKKPGKLTEEEFEIMKNHANVGGDVFKEFRKSLKIFNDRFYKVAEEIARYHHEKWDGSGYPDQLKGDDIPLSARIVAIGDVFDALTSHRVYKKAFNFDESVEIIIKSKGTHFDPVIVDAFIDKIDEIRCVYDNN